MRPTHPKIAATLPLLLGALGATAQAPIVYPAKNQSAEQRAEAKKQEQMGVYNRANTACLEGRGYTVK